MKTDSAINISDLYDKKEEMKDVIFLEVNNSLMKNHKSKTSHFNYYTDYGLIFFLTRGSLSVTLDGKEWNMDSEKACLLFLHPRDTINNAVHSADIEGYLIGIHREEISNGILSMKNNTVFPWSQMLKATSNRSPVCQVNEQEKELVSKQMERIKETFNRKDFVFHNIMLKLTLTELMLELINILAPKIEKMEVQMPQMRKVGYKESICNEFLLLAIDNHRIHHTLDFYAERLHISTQYLTHLVKMVHGYTANKIINDMLLLDAKSMLKIPTKSIKEIAFELHFADQSSFGKFFKKHTGIAASKFRKMK